MRVPVIRVWMVVADNGATERDDGFAWPVAIIGGVVVLAGLYALRAEFNNWRQRRADRRG
jgi:hypothetical protein